MKQFMANTNMFKCNSHFLEEHTKLQVVHFLEFLLMENVREEVN